MARISPAAERPTIRTVPDDLWQGFIVPTLSKHDPKPRTGRPRIDQRRARDGVLFILRTGCQWNRLPAEFGNDTAPGLRRASGTRPPPRVARARWSELARVLAPHAGSPPRVTSTSRTTASSPAKGWRASTSPWRNATRNSSSATAGTSSDA
ncbi:MAG: transposase, partial [Phycisphaerales bacterium]|nr:transposase [Phycisphaerales bacterium]